MKFLQTAERINSTIRSDNFVYMRSLFAYKEAKKYIYGDVVELGCGEGYAINELAGQVDRYIAVDKYSTTVEKIELRKNVEFIKMNIPPLKYIAFNSYDVVICFQTIEHIKADSFFLNDIYRVLKPGGKLILTTPNKLMSLSRNPWHVREYTAWTMQAIIKKVFTKCSFKGIHGDEHVNAYYERNKKSIHKLKKFDFFDLENRLPNKLWRIPYDILNRINRLSLTRATDYTFAETNFFINDNLEHCLDFFVVAEK